MSVFTPLERDELAEFVARYPLGRLRDFSGIAAGSENSNFFVSLEQAECVLTLVERGPVQDLPFFVELLECLHQADLPVPYAHLDSQGVALQQLKGKPALLQPRLLGKHVHTPNAQHCAEIGRFLARLHLATADGHLQRQSDRGFVWMTEQGPALLADLDDAGQMLLTAALGEIQTLLADLPSLPRAVLHADLFRDNALFDGNRLSGVIDFYNACSGWMLYDVAITVNDWCSDEHGVLDEHLARALLGAYAAERPFTAQENEHWPTVLRATCVRFWLSRLLAVREHQGRRGEVLVKDPREFQTKLAARQQVSLHLPIAL